VCILRQNGWHLTPCALWPHHQGSTYEVDETTKRGRASIVDNVICPHDLHRKHCWFCSPLGEEEEAAVAREARVTSCGISLWVFLQLLVHVLTVPAKFLPSRPPVRRRRRGPHKEETWLRYVHLVGYVGKCLHRYDRKTGLLLALICHRRHRHLRLL
jgi:hypothetical protein